MLPARAPPDAQAMGSIFAGLVQVGAWGCFDEFNRINIEVLSVVSAQLRAIQNALVGGRPTVDIGLGGEMKVKLVDGFATCGFFITMNPGYAGRTELPDNLKALFRPVTMIVPDLLQICEIMLFSEGFEAAKVRALCTGETHPSSNRVVAFSASSFRQIFLRTTTEERTCEHLHDAICGRLVSLV